MKFKPNEPWKKVYGPIFVYLNSLSNGESPILLWEDAKKQVLLPPSAFYEMKSFFISSAENRFIDVNDVRMLIKLLK